MSGLYVQDLVGIGFEEIGRCYGLVREVKRRLGEDLPVFDTPDDDESIVKLIIVGIDFTEPIVVPEPYCLVLFSITNPLPHHVGIVLEDCTRFIHVLRKRNVTIEKLHSPLWKNCIRGYYRWIGKN